MSSVGPCMKKRFVVRPPKHFLSARRFFSTLDLETQRITAPSDEFPTSSPDLMTRSVSLGRAESNFLLCQISDQTSQRAPIWTAKVAVQSTRTCRDVPFVLIAQVLSICVSHHQTGFGSLVPFSAKKAQNELQKRAQDRRGVHSRLALTALSSGRACGSNQALPNQPMTE